MLYAEDFRRIARQALTGKWGVAVGTGLVAALLGGASSGGSGGGSSSSNFSNSRWEEQLGNLDFLGTSFGRFLLFVILGIGSIAILYALFILFIGGAIQLGYVRFNKNLINGTNPQFSDLFSKFSFFWRGFLMRLLVSIYTFLWFLLFIIPGIIAAYSYAMTPYILEEEPYMPINEAISRSKEMMRGNKWRLFCLEISFIGWGILCLLTCGIGYLWLTPYMSASKCAFYYDVSGKYYNQSAGPNYQQNAYNNSNYNNTNYNNM